MQRFWEKVRKGPGCWKGKGKRLSVYFFPNGNAAVFNEHDEQVAELQTSWLLLFVQHLAACGVNPLEATYQLPNGKSATLFKTDSGYNWSIE